MPQRTLDEQFRQGPPRRDPDDSRDELNEEEKLFVLWGLKEEMTPSGIAQALGVDEAAIAQFHTDLVGNPDGILDLDVIEPIEDQGVTMFRCIVCSVHLNSADRIDRHALAHFLRGPDLESAIDARLLSARQHETPISQTSSADNAGEVPVAGEEERHSSPQAENEEGDVAFAVPPDADRTEIMQALRRLAALPNTSEPPESPQSEPVRSASDTPKPETLQPNLVDMDTGDVHSAFERMAERRGVTEEPAEPTADFTRGDRSKSRIQQPQPAAASGHVRDTGDDELLPVVRSPEEVNGAGTPEDERQRRGLARIVDYLTGWARSANAERQRRDVVGGMGSVKEATSVTIESGMMKILSTRMLDVVDYRVVPLSPQLYAGGVVVDAGTISRHLAAALADMKGAHRWVYATVPGYQSGMRRFDLPDVREIDPKEVIPREARRALGVAVDNATLRWQRLPGRSRIARWLVAVASETSYSAISSVIRGAGHKVRALELRPFPLTRAVGHTTMICVFVSSDGCDVVVVRNWEPHTYQSVYWEAGSVSDSSDLVRRLTEVVENTIDLHNLHNPEVSLTPDVPLAVTGGETEQHANLGMLVASNVGRNLVEGKNPLNAPSDFPYDSMVVNVGLALWDV